MSGFVTAAAVFVGATVHSSIESGKARRDQKRAMEREQKRNKLQTARQAIDSVKEAQTLRAQVIAQGEGQGVGGSSAVLGGAGAIQSQTGSNIGFAQQIFSLQQSANRLRTSAQGHMGNAQNLAAVASIAGMAAGSIGSGGGGSASGTASGGGASTASFQGAPIGFGN